MTFLSSPLHGGATFSLSGFLRVQWAWHVRRRYVTFSASQFQHLWEDVGPVAHPYNWHPLAQLNGVRRGAVIEKWVRRMLQDTCPGCVVEDAVPGHCVNGVRRSPHQAEYDFLCDGRKVEIKSAQLLGGNPGERWVVRFGGIQFQASSISSCTIFDDLYLVIFSPKWLHLVRHDLQTGLSNSGRHVTVFGKQGNWEESLDLILDRLCTSGKCKLIGKTDISDSWIADECERNVDHVTRLYVDKPFASMSPQLRGFRIERLVREFDKLLHSESEFSRPSRCLQVCSSSDWIRGKTRVEVKSSQLHFSHARQRWCCAFWAIKPNSFDELLLAIYSPRGLDVFRHDGAYGCSKTGVHTESKGCVFVYASCGETDPLSALQQIEAKLQANNCPKVASIAWDVWVLEHVYLIWAIRHLCWNRSVSSQSSAKPWTLVSSLKNKTCCHVSFRPVDPGFH